MKKNILLLMIIFLLVGCSNSTDERAEVSSDNGVTIMLILSMER